MRSCWMPCSLGCARTSMQVSWILVELLSSSQRRSSVLRVEALLSWARKVKPEPASRAGAVPGVVAAGVEELLLAEGVGVSE